MKATSHHFQLPIRLDHYKTPPSLKDAVLPNPYTLGRLLGRLQQNDNVDGPGGRVDKVAGGLIRVGDGYAAGRSFVVWPTAWVGESSDLARSAMELHHKELDRNMQYDATIKRTAHNAKMKMKQKEE